MSTTIEIGDLVWNGHGGWLRFGYVTKKQRADNGWVYFTVDWLRDEKYQSAQDYYYSINPKGNYGLVDFRPGQLYRIEPERLNDILEAYSVVQRQGDVLEAYSAG